MENKNCTTLKFKSVHLKTQGEIQEFLLKGNSYLKQCFAYLFLTPYATTGY